MVGLAGQVSLGVVDFDVLPVDLLSVGSDLLLNVIVLSVFLIQEEPQVVQFLLQPHNSHRIRVVLGLEVVILQQLIGHD